MDVFSFGPRDDAIIQIAYTVADIEQGMRQYGELLRVGPWFLIGPFVPPKGRYRGAATKANFSLALAYTGELMIELIAQHDNEPSVFQETLKARGAHGFHHWAVGARDFEKTAERYRARGYQEAFTDTAPEHWVAASSISTPDAFCRACWKSSRSTPPRRRHFTTYRRQRGNGTERIM
jgi:Glyoxalase/Bleomycin resistance protein/Dioxygenase superfamily